MKMITALVGKYSNDCCAPLRATLHVFHRGLNRINPIVVDTGAGWYISFSLSSEINIKMRGNSLEEIEDKIGSPSFCKIYSTVDLKLI